MRFNRVQLFLLFNTAVCLIPPLSNWLEAKASMPSAPVQISYKTAESSLQVSAETIVKAKTPSTEEFSSYVQVFDSVGDDPEHANARKVGAHR